MTSPSSPVVRLLRLVAPRRLALAAAASAASDLAAVALMATAAWLISRAAEQPPLAALTVAIVAVRAFALARGVFRYAERLAGHEAALAALARLRTRVYAALVPLAPTGLPAFRGGDLLSRMVADVDAVQDLLLRCLIPAVVAVVVGAAAVGLTTALLPVAGAILAAGLAVAGALLPTLAVAASGRTARRSAAARGELAVRTVDLLHGAADLAAFGATGSALEGAERVGARLARLERSAAVVEGVTAAVGVLVQGLTALAVTAVALDAVADGHLSRVLLAVLALTALSAFEVTVPLPAAARKLVEVRAAARRLAAVLDARSPLPEPDRPVPVPSPPVTVTVDGVRVRYDPAGPPALDGVDLLLAPGRRVALVGPSGSGKSTLLAALTRFVATDAGRITVGGVNLRCLAGDDVRRLVRGATQDAHVFHATVRENLRLAAPDATDAELAEAARQARLLDWVESLPEGWDTLVGEDGGQLSGGQRQRLVLARALLADPPVLLLDEPTEGLDPATADAVVTETLDATRGRTTLLVTHRLTGLDAVDEVVVLDAGRVVQRGHHRDLVAEPGYYQDAWKAERLAEAATHAPARVAPPSMAGVPMAGVP